MFLLKTNQKVNEFDFSITFSRLIHQFYTIFLKNESKFFREEESRNHLEKSSLMSKFSKTFPDRFGDHSMDFCNDVHCVHFY